MWIENVYLYTVLTCQFNEVFGDATTYMIGFSYNLT